MDCQHKNKAYSNMGITLTSYPPRNISYWICKDCGWEDKDSHQEKLRTEYEDTRHKFGRGHNGTSYITSPTIMSSQRI